MNKSLKEKNNKNESMTDINALDAYKIGGVLLTIILSLSSLVVLFSKRYTAKDKAFTETIQSVSIQFTKSVNETMVSIMNFVERKDAQMNAINAEYIKAIKGLQEQIEKAGSVTKELAIQVHEQNVILRGQHERIKSSEVEIMEIKAQLNEVAILIKQKL